MSIQNKRRESMYFRAVSKIVAEHLTNVNLSNTTVTGVRLSSDGSNLVVYVVFEKNKTKSLEALNNAKGFVRTELARFSSQRIVPKLVFEYDKTVDSANRIEEILRKIKEEKK